MADLDDFFAKKDRKKTKTKKFATSDELAKKLEDTTKKCELKRKETQLPSTQPDAAAVEIESAADQVIVVAEVSFCVSYIFFLRRHFRICYFAMECVDKTRIVSSHCN